MISLMVSLQPSDRQPLYTLPSVTQVIMLLYRESTRLTHRVLPGQIRFLEQFSKWIAKQSSPSCDNNIGFNKPRF